MSSKSQKSKRKANETLDIFLTRNQGSGSGLQQLKRQASDGAIVLSGSSARANFRSPDVPSTPKRGSGSQQLKRQASGTLVLSGSPKIGRFLPFRFKTEHDFNRYLADLDLDEIEKKKCVSNDFQAPNFEYITASKGIQEIKNLREKLTQKEQQKKKSQDELEQEFITTFESFEEDSNFLCYLIPETEWYFVRQCYKMQFVGTKISGDDSFFFFHRKTYQFHWNDQIGPEEIKEKHSRLIQFLVKERHLLSFRPQLRQLAMDSNSVEYNDLNVVALLAKDENGKRLEDSLAVECKKIAREQQLLSTNYLLLDPRHFDEYDGKVPFVAFLKSIFYIGQTKKETNRPIQHLDKVKTKNKTYIKENRGASFKKATIMDIWDDKRGVVALQIFPYTVEEVSRFREKCMILARTLQGAKQTTITITVDWPNLMLGPIDLTNKTADEKEKDPTRKPVFRNWSETECRVLGTRLLLRAYGIFQMEDRVEIFRDNLAGVKRDSSTSSAPLDQSGLHLSSPKASVSSGADEVFEEGI